MSNFSKSSLSVSTLPRIERIEYDGQVAWLKRPEQINGRMRLQKGDPAAAFLAEKTTYKRLVDNGMPLPKLLDAGDDYFIIADAGPNLVDLLRDKSTSDETSLRALIAAATALANLHCNGVAHGRPALKDICWKDDQITFIDWERSGPARNNKKGFSTDVIIFFFTMVVETGGVSSVIYEMKNAYRCADNNRIYECATGRIRRLYWALALLSPIINCLQSKPEFRAIKPFLQFFK